MPLVARMTRFTYVMLKESDAIGKGARASNAKEHLHRCHESIHGRGAELQGVRRLLPHHEPAREEASATEGGRGVVTFRLGSNMLT